MELVLDASSVILLAKADILMEICALANIIITAEVKQEVMKGLERGRKDALLLRELVKEGKIKQSEADKALTGKLQNDFKLGIGESATISLALTKNIPLATDDNKARKAAKILGLSVLSTLDFPFTLHSKGVITREKAKSCIKVFRKEGWFDEHLIEKALEQLEETEGEET